MQTLYQVYHAALIDLRAAWGGYNACWTKRPAPLVIDRNNIISLHIRNFSNQPVLHFWKTFYQFQSEGEVVNFEILRKEISKFF